MKIFVSHSGNSPWRFRISNEDALGSVFTLFLCRCEVARTFRGFKDRSEKSKLMVNPLKL